MQQVSEITLYHPCHVREQAYSLFLSKSSVPLAHDLCHGIRGSLEANREAIVALAAQPLC